MSRREGTKKSEGRKGQMVAVSTKLLHIVLAGSPNLSDSISSFHFNH